jgi:hypothetical protein
VTKRSKKRPDEQQVAARSTGTKTNRVIRESSKVARKEDVLRSANATGVATKVMPTEMIAAAMVMPIEKATTAIVHFPLCDAAVRKMERNEWDLADAILAECFEPGEDGVQNGSQAKMEAMRDEIAKNHGIELSVVRIRKLRKVASAFPADRRRPGVSLEGHLEAGTPEALDALIKGAPNGTALTREYIRRLKHPDEKAEQDQQADERRRQVDDHRKALQNVCRQLEQENEQLRLRYTDVCRTNGKEPEPFSPPLVPEDDPSLSVADDLARSVRALLTSRGFDPAADIIKQAIADFVKAVLAQQQ